MSLPRPAVILLLLASMVPAGAAAQKVKVFILAGQSNMEGKGFPRPLSWQVSRAEYRERYTRFVKGGDYGGFTAKLRASLDVDGDKPVYDWAVRGDVWVDYHGRHGDLTVGYAPGATFLDRSSTLGR